jgi:hypothetical protein
MAIEKMAVEKTAAEKMMVDTARPAGDFGFTPEQGVEAELQIPRDPMGGDPQCL